MWSTNIYRMHEWQIHHRQLKKTQTDVLPVRVNNIPVINEVRYSNCVLWQKAEN